MASQACGYDEEFVNTPPDYLKCIVCHLVLRDPIQLIDCGHHYCSGCFNNVKEYASHLNSELLCPVDRKIIDLAKVAKDRCFERLVGDLQVKCKFQNVGCPWVGELRNIETHKQECGHALKEADTMPMEILNEILVRLEKCEAGILEKEKDIAYLKFNLKETRDELVKRDEEVESLKQKMLCNDEVQKVKDKEMENLKQLVEELKQKGLKWEMESNSNKEEIHKCVLNEEEIEKSLKQKDNKINNLNIEITDLKTDELGKKALKSESCEGGINVGSGGKETAVGAVGGCADENTFVWNCKINELRVNKNTYSPHFYCCNNGNKSKLRVYMWPDKKIHLGFDVGVRPIKSKGTYKVNVELLKLDGSNMKEKICTKEFVVYGSALLCYMDENQYKNYIDNNILNISISWKCHH